MYDGISKLELPEGAIVISFANDAGMTIVALDIEEMELRTNEAIIEIRSGVATLLGKMFTNKRIRNIVPFRGEPGTLVSFIGTIDGVVSEFGGRENEVYNIVYNEKITGAAKDFLAADFPVSWELCKQRLRSHFRPAKEWAVISKEITNIKAILLLILMTTTTQAGLLTTSIDEQWGYLKLKVKTVQIVNETNTILHVINPEEILKTIVEIRVNLKHLDFENRNIIDREIDTVVAKTKSIMPYRNI
ncbi:uncharacterized protein LOC119652022 [Hermetia illucens]|uniref:uncharacterized protein LOC119652022 n=1 Tax=Hermetia illucens TaxID=343691 RepID=UPI0018CC19D9|nr:uncharacterized protein LOC119652022 [Hermetia illucens]